MPTTPFSQAFQSVVPPKAPEVNKFSDHSAINMAPKMTEANTVPAKSTIYPEHIRSNVTSGQLGTGKAQFDTHTVHSRQYSSGQVQNMVKETCLKCQQTEFNFEEKQKFFKIQNKEQRQEIDELQR